MFLVSGFLALGSWFLVLGSGLRITALSTQYPVPSIQHPATSIQHLISNEQTMLKRCLLKKYLLNINCISVIYQPISNFQYYAFIIIGIKSISTSSFSLSLPAGRIIPALDGSDNSKTTSSDVK